MTIKTFVGGVFVMFTDFVKPEKDFADLYY